MHRERSTCPGEQVAVNITPPSSEVRRNSRVTDAKLETFEHAGEIVRVPAVSEYQSHGERLGVLTGLKVAWRSPK